MTKPRTAIVAATLLAIFAPTQVARADIYQWEYVNPANPSWGKQQSTLLTPDGAGVNAVPAANLANRNLTKAFLPGASLANANLRNATFVYADFSTGSIDFLQASLGLTTNLMGANLRQANLTNADFSGFDAYGPEGEYYPFLGANLEGANMSGADTRGANFYLASWSGANTSNMILSNGHIAGLDLTAAESLTIRDYDGIAFFAPIVVEQQLAMSGAGTLRLVIDADPWDSTIYFAPSSPVTRGGTLELTFAADVEVASQIGRTIDLFDWTGVAPTGTFTISSLYTWNLTNLYTTGEVTLLAIPALPGDYNGDGTVDTADFVAWRKNDGTPAGFDTWRANFGATLGSSSSQFALPAVPEPTSVLLLLSFAATGVWRHRRGLH
jgi:uncharacterized protein YjbI with pentapeptide repeats